MKQLKGSNEIKKTKITTVIFERKILVCCCKQKQNNVNLAAENHFVLI